MRYPVVIEPGTDSTAFGVIVPDLPGCFSAGDSLDEALAGAEEAAAAWIDAALDAGEAIPAPGSLETLRRNPGYAGWAFGVIALDPALLDDTPERVNITLPRRVLKHLDALARAAGESRSGYIAQLTLEGPRPAALYSLSIRKPGKTQAAGYGSGVAAAAQRGEEGKAADEQGEGGRFGHLLEIDIQ